MRSDTISELAKALAAAQADLEGSKKLGDNPFFHSKYSTLASVWDAIKEPFTKHGLSFVQPVNFDPNFPEHVFVDTTMLHTSGEFISGRIGMKPVKSDPQSVGSCITYCRRYGLQSLSGVAPEDDDGNAASGQGKAPTPPKQTTTKTPVPTPPSQVQPPDVPDMPGVSTQTETMSERAQWLIIAKLAEEIGLVKSQIPVEASLVINRVVTEARELTFADAQDTIKAFTERRDKLRAEEASKGESA